MALGSIVQRGLPIFSGFVLLFALIEMIITAVLVSSYNSTDSYPDGSYKGAIRFLLFTSIWTLVTGGGLLAAFFLATSSIVASIASFGAWAALTWLFWMAGAAAITAATSGSLHCHHSALAHCYQLQATEGFAWIQFILFVLFIGLLIFLGVRSSRNGNGFAGSMIA